LYRNMLAVAATGRHAGMALRSLCSFGQAIKTTTHTTLAPIGAVSIFHALLQTPLFRSSLHHSVK
jgi:hypothetical protein